MTDYIIRDDQSRKVIIGLLERLNLDKPWDVTVRRHRDKRSLNQNRLYHEIIGLIADETGHSHDEIHEYVKAKFLPPRQIEMNGNAITVSGSTATLTTAQMAELTEYVMAWAASELGIVMPVQE